MAKPKIVALALGVCLLSACAIHVAKDSFFHPAHVAVPQTVYQRLDRSGYVAKSIFFAAADGTRLHGMLLTRPGNHVTILFFTGNNFKLGLDDSGVFRGT